MTKDVPSVLEHRAKLRKRGEFVTEVKNALQPIFEKYCGRVNSGTAALQVAEAAMSKAKPSIDDRAIEELEATIQRFWELARETTE